MHNVLQPWWSRTFWNPVLQRWWVKTRTGWPATAFILFESETNPSHSNGVHCSIVACSGDARSLGCLWVAACVFGIGYWDHHLLVNEAGILEWWTTQRKLTYLNPKQQDSLCGVSFKWTRRKPVRICASFPSYERKQGLFSKGIFRMRSVKQAVRNSAPCGRCDLLRVIYLPSRGSGIQAFRASPALYGDRIHDCPHKVIQRKANGQMCQKHRLANAEKGLQFSSLTHVDEEKGPHTKPDKFRGGLCSGFTNSGT